MGQEAVLAEKVEKLLAEPVAALGIHLLEVQFRFEGRWILRLLIEREGGINLDHCGEVSELAGRILDVEDPIPHEFSLEVSSPGLYRTLKSPKHFHQSIGKIVRITLDADCLEELKDRVLRGEILEAGETTLVLKVKDNGMEIPMDGIINARLDPDL